MTRTLIRVLAVLAVFGLVACGDATVDLDPETGAIVDGVEGEISRLGDEIDASGVEAELAAAWESLETRLTSAVDSVRSGEAIDTEAIRTEVEEFQSDLESSEAAATVRDAWSTLRAQLDQMLSQLG
ncbi:MAG TPA: hypothetical protein VLB85_08110 [Acidimicrobiia bacterium]|nr:hypothetical protein [Acidimicrobiia bacterium]